MATLQFRLGHYEQARTLAEQALTHTDPDAPSRADALLVLGNCATETNDLAAGEDFYRRAIDLSQQLGYYRALFRGLHDMSAGVYIPRGQFDLALAADEQAYRIARERNLLDMIQFPLISMAWAYQLIGQRQRAHTALNELSQVVSCGSSSQGYYYALSAEVAQDEGSPETALALHTHARSIAEATGEPGLNIWMRLSLSRYHHINGSAADAFAWANDALTIAIRVRYRHLQGLALTARGRAAWDIGDLPIAESDLRAAVEILSTLQAAFDLARTRLVLAAFLHQQQREEAAAVLRDAAHGIVSGGYAFLLDQEGSVAFPLIAAYLNSADTDLAEACAACMEHLKRVPPEPLRVATFGSLCIWQGRRAIPRNALRRHAGELFSLLLLNPSHSLSSEQFSGSLCPDQDPGSARVQFHHATSTLRRALEPELPDKFPSRYLEVEEGRITLHLPPGSSVDFELFEAHCQSGKWEDALSLYRGEFLHEYLYAEWATTPRLRLVRLYLRALLAIAEQKLSHGLFQEVLDACHRVLAIEPWQEQAVLLGMQACLGLNDRAQARHLYHNLENSLHQDLNTEPPKELQLLYQSLGGRMRNKTK